MQVFARAASVPASASAPAPFPETAVDQMRSVFHDDLSRAWMAFPDSNIAEHARLLEPHNLSYAFTHSYGVGDSTVWGIFIPHAFDRPRKRLLGFWFNQGLDRLIKDLFHRINLSADAIGKYVSRFILHLDTGIGHCVEWFDTGHALISIHHYSPTVGRFEADLVFTSPVRPKEVPTMPTAAFYIKRDCPYCRQREILCRCTRHFRRRLFAQANFRGLTWGTFASRLTDLNVSCDQFTIDVKALDGKVCASMSFKSRSTYSAIGPGSRGLVLSYLKALGCYVDRPDRDIRFVTAARKQYAEAGQVLQPIAGRRPSVNRPQLIVGEVEEVVGQVRTHFTRGPGQQTCFLDQEDPSFTSSFVKTPRADNTHVRIDLEDNASIYPDDTPSPVTDFSLDKHEVPPPVVTERVKFQCPHCSAVFKQQAHTDLHVSMVHKRLRPFICEQCKQTFGSKSNLNRHVRTVHEGIKPARKPKKLVAAATV
mmetsp:Transcript_36424/g.88967  ORF Transcript_36424/g.88967 Transcript_36424/m.88967 type:complete len:480 (+) Transcript_36424:121-1560(+)